MNFHIDTSLAAGEIYYRFNKNTTPLAFWETKATKAKSMLFNRDNFLGNNPRFWGNINDKRKFSVEFEAQTVSSFFRYYPCVEVSITELIHDTRVVDINLRLTLLDKLRVLFASSLVLFTVYGLFSSILKMDIIPVFLIIAAAIVFKDFIFKEKIEQEAADTIRAMLNETKSEASINFKI